MAEQWLSIVEYARTYQVSDMTVRRRIKTGRLHAVLKEGKYFIPVPVGETRVSAPAADATAAPKRHAGEMTVIKGHPSAHSTYANAFGAPTDTRPSQTPPRVTGHVVSPVQETTVRNVVEMNDDDSDTTLPASLRRPLAGQDTSLVDTRALLAFCEASMRKLNESERRTVEKFKSKLEALEANIVTRDHEIKTLRQQVEDLQLLVKILEGKAS